MTAAAFTLFLPGFLKHSFRKLGQAALYISSVGIVSRDASLDLLGLSLSRR